MAENTNWETLGQVKSLGSLIAKLEYHVDKTDTTWFLLMKDFTRRQEVNYFSIKFHSQGNALLVFYELLLSFFDDSNRNNKSYMQTFTLGSTGVNLQHCTLIATHGVRLTTRDGYINLSKKDIEKLFGKR